MGYILVLASFIYIAYSLYHTRGDLAVLESLRRVLVLNGVFSVILVTCVLAFAYSLKLNLEFLSNQKLKALEAMEIHIKANLCKYLPGNVMQYVTRNLYAQNIGVSQIKMAFGSLLEIFFVAATSFILCVMFSRELFLNLIHDYVPISMYIVLVFIFIAILIILFILLRKIKRFEQFIKETMAQLKEVKLSRFFKLALKMFCIVAYNHILLGTVFFLLLREVSSITDISVFTVISAYVIAWLVGFITPGAPGGIGVKETILSLLLMDFYGREYVLVAALLFRLVTIGADVFAFGFFMIFKKAMLYVSKNRKEKEA